MQVREREIEPWMQGGNYADDPAFRERFQAALAGYWREKDELPLIDLDGPEFVYS